MNKKLRTYVKVEGDNVEDIVQRLARISVNAPEVCVMDSNIREADWLPQVMAETDQTNMQSSPNGFTSYFGMEPEDYEQCDRIISKSGTDLGGASIYFEWFKPPTEDQLRELKHRIDNVMKPYSNKYQVWAK